MIETEILLSDNQETPTITGVQTRELELGNSTIHVRYAADVEEGYLERLRRFCSPLPEKTR